MSKKSANVPRLQHTEDSAWDVIQLTANKQVGKSKSAMGVYLSTFRLLQRRVADLFCGHGGGVVGSCLETQNYTFQLF